MQESFGKRIWVLSYPLLTYIGVGYLVSFLFSFGCYLWMVLNSGISILADTEELTEAMAVMYNGLLNEINIVTFVITIPLLILYMHLDKKHAAILNVKRAKSVSWYKFLILPFMGAAVCVAGTFMTVLGGWQLIGMNNVAEEFFCGKTVIELISIGILYPVADELLFRGLLYVRLRVRMPKYAAAAFASLVYAFYSTNLSQGVYAFCVSLLLTYIYERYNSIIAPILFSIAANVITVLEKEKGILRPFYDSYGRFVAVTVGLCVLVIVFVLFIEKFVCEKNGDGAEPSVSMD